MFERRSSLSLLVLSSVLLLSGCLGDDDPVGPAVVTDADAPVVVAIDPAPDASGVAVDRPVLITFNEPIVPESVIGRVELNEVAASDLTWLDDRTLRVDHARWPAGHRVDVTLDGAIVDPAGNRLERRHVSGFWTESPDLVVLATQPVHGAVDADRNTTLRIKFSHRVVATSLADAITVNAGPGVDAPTFDVIEGADGWYVIEFHDSLPPGRLVTVTVASVVRASQPVSMTSPKVFAFTTGRDRDRQAPRVLEVVPRARGTIDPSTNGVTVVFDEAIDGTRVEIVPVSAQAAVLLDHYGITPVWSEDRTRMTLPLPSPLPPGMPIEIRFDSIADASGNGLAEPLEFDLSVDGPAAEWPLTDGLTRSLVLRTFDLGGTGAGIVERRVHRREERIDASRFRVATYDDADFRRLIGYEELRSTDEFLARTAFTPVFDERLEEIRVGSVVELLRRPLLVDTWTTRAAAFDGEDFTQIDVTVEITGREDVPSSLGLGTGGSLPPLVARDAASGAQRWVDCWKAVITTVERDGAQIVSSQVETVYFAPAIGPVRRTVDRDVMHDGVPIVERTVEDVVDVDMRW